MVGWWVHPRPNRATSRSHPYPSLPQHFDSTPDEVRSGLQSLDDLAGKAGRAPGSISVSVFGLPADRDLISEFFDAGADRVMVSFETADADRCTAFRQLSRVAEAVLF